mmetsp:Transcript_26899/g.58726  ORF Transcript_26899/g.58726 Transcript_26899/m.58726 type:complete len:223 (-) Transcript_26899:464-1132(-)
MYSTCGKEEQADPCQATGAGRWTCSCTLLVIPKQLMSPHLAVRRSQAATTCTSCGCSSANTLSGPNATPAALPAAAAAAVSPVVLVWASRNATSACLNSPEHVGTKCAPPCTYVLTQLGSNVSMSCCVRSGGTSASLVPYTNRLRTAGRADVRMRAYDGSRGRKPATIIANLGCGTSPRSTLGKQASSRAVAVAPWLKPRMPSGLCSLIAATSTSSAASQPV